MISIEINSDTITPGLDELSRLLDDLTPVMQAIGEYLVEATNRRFQEGKAPDGSPWAPKSAATLANYKRRGVNAPKPLFGESRALSSQIFYQAGRYQVEVGSPRIYAAAMQFGAAKGAFGTTSRGAPIPWGNIPARPFLGISAEDETAIVGIVGEWIERATGQP